jgi:hypothetical protein
MFRNNFCVALKSGEKFFRENGERIELPFGTEYSVYLKNLNSRRAVVKVSIDGNDVLDNSSLVIQPGSVLELEGFITGNFAKNRFKFIERNKEIEEYRGIKPEDGIVSVEFDFEKEKPLTKEITYVPHYPYPYSDPYWYPWWTYTIKTSPYDYSITWSDTLGNGTFTSSRGTSCGNHTSNSTMYMNADVHQEGITVEGNDVSQRFYGTYIGEMENRPTVISFKLYGFNKKITDQKIVYTKDKKFCKTCGRENKYKNKFCYCCGTRLVDLSAD